MKRHLIGLVVALTLFLLSAFAAEYYKVCIAHNPRCGDPDYWGHKPE